MHWHCPYPECDAHNALPTKTVESSVRALRHHITLAGHDEGRRVWHRPRIGVYVLHDKHLGDIGSVRYRDGAWYADVNADVLMSEFITGPWEKKADAQAEVERVAARLVLVAI